MNVNKQSALFFLGVLALAGISAAIYDYEHNRPPDPILYSRMFGKKPRPNTSNEEVELVTVGEILSDYKSDPAKAEAKYKDKEFRITGLIGKVGTGFSELSVLLVAPEYLPKGIEPDDLPLTRYDPLLPDVELEGVSCAIGYEGIGLSVERDSYERSASAMLRCRIMGALKRNSKQGPDADKKKQPNPTKERYLISALTCVEEQRDFKKRAGRFP